MKDDNINIKGTYPNFSNKESVEIRGPLKCGNNIKIDNKVHFPHSLGMLKYKQIVL